MTGSLRRMRFSTSPALFPTLSANFFTSICLYLKIKLYLCTRKEVEELFTAPMGITRGTAFYLFFMFFSQLLIPLVFHSPSPYPVKHYRGFMLSLTRETGFLAVSDCKRIHIFPQSSNILEEKYPFVSVYRRALLPTSELTVQTSKSEFQES